jgi:hypothetical protein
MANPSLSSAGDSDTVFIERLREFMEDMPLFSPEGTTASGAASEIRLSDFPVYDGDTYDDSSQRFTVTVNGALQNLVDSRDDLANAGDVAIDYESGWLYWFPGTPPNGQVAVRKSKVRWRNERMLEALYGGLNAMSRVCRSEQYDTSLVTQPYIWEYTLPPVFYDPAVRITDVEVLDVPNLTNRYFRTPWRRGTLDTIILPSSQQYVFGATIRINYLGPYQALSDIPTSEGQLPLMWAKGYLLTNKEIQRARQDTANVSTDQNANPVGASQNAGAFFFSRFEAELERLKRVQSVAPPLSVYNR